MAVKVKNYSFDPDGVLDPRTPVLVEAIPEQQRGTTTTGEEDTDKDEERHPSDVAIMVGMGLVGWVIG